MPDKKPDSHTLRALLVRLLDGLERVHNSGLLHRSIKPENIVVTAEGKPVLIDFGSPLKALDPSAEIGSEWPKAVNAYDPHEFFVTGSKQGPSADLYSLAACFYHLICGTTPADCQHRMSAMLSQRPDPYIPLGNLTDEFDEAFCKTIDGALAILPRHRMRSARQWRETLSEKIPQQNQPQPRRYALTNT
ncbi:MAG: hypothetical protein AAF590_13955 [Pseudomonadota bacterium]